MIKLCEDCGAPAQSIRWSPRCASWHYACPAHAFGAGGVQDLDDDDPDNYEAAPW